MSSRMLPGVKKLRSRLGYGDGGQNRGDPDFRTECQLFITRYTDTDGQRGSVFWDKKNERDVKGIRDMTAAFLKEFGELFWPSESGLGNANKLSFTKDKDLITNGMEDLLFKMNYYAKLRSTNKDAAISIPHPLTLENQTPSTHQSTRGSTADDPIDLESPQFRVEAHGAEVFVQPMASRQNLHSPAHNSFSIRTAQPESGSSIWNNIVMKARKRAPEEYAQNKRKRRKQMLPNSNSVTQVKQQSASDVSPCVAHVSELEITPEFSTAASPVSVTDYASSKNSLTDIVTVYSVTSSPGLTSTAPDALETAGRHEAQDAAESLTIDRTANAATSSITSGLFNCLRALLILPPMKDMFG